MVVVVVVIGSGSCSSGWKIGVGVNGCSLVVVWC